MTVAERFCTSRIGVARKPRPYARTAPERLSGTAAQSRISAALRRARADYVTRGPFRASPRKSVFFKRRMKEHISRRTFLAAAAAGVAWGQERSEQDTTFSADVKVVNVLTTVRDKQGKIVADLTKDDFALAEEGRPQTIRYFSRETNLPPTLGLLVDTSLSQRKVLGEERDASRRFVEKVLRPDRDQTFLIHFDHDTELLQDLTSSKDRLERALNQLELPDDARPQTRRGGGGYPGGGGGYPGGGG